MNAAVQALIVNGGTAGAVLVLMLMRVLIPKWYVTKLESQISYLEQNLRIQKEINRDAVNTAANANQMIGELKKIALQRAQYEEHKEPPGLSWKDIS